MSMSAAAAVPWQRKHVSVPVLHESQVNFPFGTQPRPRHDGWKERGFLRRRVVRLAQVRARKIQLSQCVARSWLARRARKRLELGDDWNADVQEESPAAKQPREPLWQPRRMSAAAAAGGAAVGARMMMQEEAAAPAHWAGMLRGGPAPAPLGFGAGSPAAAVNKRPASAAPAASRRPASAAPSGTRSSRSSSSSGSSRPATASYDRITGRRLPAGSSAGSSAGPGAGGSSGDGTASTARVGGVGDADGKGSGSLPQIRRPASAPVGRRHAGKTLLSARGQLQHPQQAAAALPLSTRAINR